MPESQATFFFQCLSRTLDVGANSYLIQAGETRVVLDAGMHPKRNGFEALPDLEKLRYDSVDAILVSHAHQDHTGALPVLVQQQPNARVHMTEETLELAQAMLHNSVNVMCSIREEAGVMEYPLFTHGELDRIIPSWEIRNPGRAFTLGQDGEVRCEFFSAGHTLGAAGMRLEWNGRSVFYTGDVHFEDQTLVRSSAFPEDPVDVLIMESTRGDSQRAPGYTREKEMLRLGQCIADALERGGSVMIPVFALGKTQETMLMIKELKERGIIDMDVPIHIGGLSTKITTLFDRFADTSRRHQRGFRILDDMPGLVAASRRSRGEIPYSRGRIYAFSSGMMTPKTVSNRFAKRILEDSRNALLFVGYADPDTPAGQILRSKKGDRIELEPGQPLVPLQCPVEKFDFSGHAPREALRDFAVKVRPRHLILVHGDLSAREWLRQAIQKELPETKIHIPEAGQRIDF